MGHFETRICICVLDMSHLITPSSRTCSHMHVFILCLVPQSVRDTNGTDIMTHVWYFECAPKVTIYVNIYLYICIYVYVYICIHSYKHIYYIWAPCRRAGRWRLGRRAFAGWHAASPRWSELRGRTGPKWARPTSQGSGLTHRLGTVSERAWRENGTAARL